MTRSIEDMLADEEAAIRDDGFSVRVTQTLRAGQMRRRALLGAFGMTGLGLAVGGILELSERGVRLVADVPHLPSMPKLDPAMTGSLLQQASALPPMELAVLAGAALALAAWVWQMASPAASE